MSVKAPFRRVLIANRGEIAIRIARTAEDLGILTVAVASQDDATSLHTRRAGECVMLRGSGAKAYLDIDQIVEAGVAAGCDAVHPGYGFLSENADFAARCETAGIAFIGPTPQALTLFGDKAQARSLARDCGVPTPQGLFGATDIAGAEAFFRSLEPGAAVILKAIAGGGGRGIRVVRSLDELPQAFERCQSEAAASFGSGELYVERFLPRARHLEVQVLGDGQGGVVHLWERECSLQRRHQKLIEIAPSPGLPEAVRRGLLESSLKLASQVGYRALGTFEFLVWPKADGDLDYAFIEANPRIQVEHTVTEAVTGVDLVAAQIRVCAGSSLGDLGLTQDRIGPPRGYAIQLRVNMERMKADGSVLPSGGVLAAFDPPSGPGVRVDTFGYAGYRTSPAFDSLLAKVIVHAPQSDFATAVGRADRALGDFRVDGVKTNLAFLRALLHRPEVAANTVYTAFIDDQIKPLVEAAEHLGEGRYFGAAATTGEGTAALAAASPPPHEGVAVGAPLQGSLLALDVKVGDAVPAGAQLGVLEAMKMEHVLSAPVSGVVVALGAAPGAVLAEGQPVLWIREGKVEAALAAEEAQQDPDHIRPDLQQVLDRKRFLYDEARPDAVARRRKRNQRTARENIDAVCDPGTFVEYGGLAVAAQQGRRPLDELIRATPADGQVTGIGSVNGALFGAQKSRALVLAYDATVLAGTQGREGHRKDQRMFELAERLKLPVIFFTEGGGGRPGDTERTGEGLSFYMFAKLSGQVPLVGVTAGYCFAGNAAFLACCDVIIATRASNIGMGGPAMVEGGGLGVFEASEIGPSPMHYETGAVDILVEDEVDAAEVAKRYLSYFQGEVAPVAPPDQRGLRHLVPLDRRRAYDIRPVIETLADAGSVLEVRAGFGHGMVTAFVRIEGRAVGVVANNPMHMAGAVDGPGADKAARFMALCDNFGIPVLCLCDTPGIMVGPESEKTGAMRRAGRLLVAAANLRVPSFTLIVRKFYGLGMIAMMMGAFKAPIFTVSWPTGEFGAMGLEGAVRLGYKKELDAIVDPVERKAEYDRLVEKMYQDGKALRKSASYDFDDVIDPAESRRWILHALDSSGAMRGRDAPKDAYVPPW